MQETTGTNALYELCNQLTTALAVRSVNKADAKGGGAFISQRKTLEWSFCTFERKKENYSQTLAVSAPLVGLKNDGPGRTIRKVEA